MYRLLAISLATISQQTGHRRAHRRAENCLLRDRCVANAHRTELLEQSDRPFEHATGRANVFAEEDHRFVAAHLLGDASRYCFTKRQLRHDPLPSAHTS
jgi:hypothetical protein